MSTWYLYMVMCADGSLYTGITTDLERRVQQHTTGSGAKYTKMKRPVTLVYSEVHPDRSAASKREYEIKQLTRQQKLQLVAPQADK